MDTSLRFSKGHHKKEKKKVDVVLLCKHDVESSERVEDLISCVLN